VLFLDAQKRLIAMEELFRGTLTQTSVYPREVVQRALQREAASVVLAHNHPSGTVQPSRADEALTQTLKAALALVDVRVLDHVIVRRAMRCRWRKRACSRRPEVQVAQGPAAHPENNSPSSRRLAQAAGGPRARRAGASAPKPRKDSFRAGGGSRETHTATTAACIWRRTNRRRSPCTQQRTSKRELQ
jgi:hypothetical protein